MPPRYSKIAERNGERREGDANIFINGIKHESSYELNVLLEAIERG